MKTLFFSISFILLSIFAKAQTDSLSTYVRMSFEELLNQKVITASNVKEKFSDAPATMIVITQTDMQERGYKSLLEMLQDLPGMDVIITNGYQGFNNYWRGYRATFNQPFLFMIDGMVQNETYYNRITIMQSVPLSNIERVEVVYGPASSVYGANALMGVINVITKKEHKEGVTTVANSTGSVSGDFIGDYCIAIHKDKLSIKLATRFEKSDLANSINFDDVEYTSPKYTQDTTLYGKYWTNVVQNNGKFTYQRQFINTDFRMSYKNTEMGVLFDSKNQGWGYYNPSDKLLYNTPSQFNTYNLWLRQSFNFTEKISAQTTLLYKLEDLPKGDWIESLSTKNKSSDTVQIANVPVAPGATVQTVDFSYWQLYNQTWSLSQTIEAKLLPNLTLMTGFQYDFQQITKMSGVSGMFYTPDSLKKTSLGFISPVPSDYKNIDNMLNWVDYGAHAQLRYSITDNHIFNAGVRIDKNSQYGTSTTFRGGYVGKYGEFGTKILYGQAYQIPTPRTLFMSGWNFVGLGSSTNLKPETSQTFELQVNYTTKNISAYISGYDVNNDNTIESVYGGAKNLGKSNIVGIDAYVNARLPVDFLKKTQLWAYYSTYLKAEQETFDNNGLLTGNSAIGDLAQHKFYLGSTTYITNNLMFNLLGRFVGQRKTVSTNPLGTIDPYFTADANIVYKNLFAKGINISLKINNLFDETYTHPGIDLANSGNEPGKWVNGVWQGSKGWSTSELPQPHRYLLITLHFDL